jgi:hypothetical protein
LSQRGRRWFRRNEKLMDWTDLRYFLGVARTGSLTRTAADLRVSRRQ